MERESNGGLKYHPKLRNWSTIVQTNELENYWLYNWLKKAFSCAIACFATHQLIAQVLPQGKKTQASTAKGVLGRIRASLKVGRRGVEESILLFWCKLAVDVYTYQENLIYSEYQKGAITGFLSFIVNRPLAQINAVKESLINKGKNIGAVEAIAQIYGLDGIQGFYKFQNLLGPLNSMLYFSVQFGLWKQLTTANDHFLNFFFVAPLVATAAATLSTLHLNKCRNFYINLHYERQARVLSEGRMLYFSKTPTRQLLDRPFHIFRMTRFEAIALSHSLYKNWMLLVAFIASQHIEQLAPSAEKSFANDIRQKEKRLQETD